MAKVTTPGLSAKDTELVFEEKTGTMAPMFLAPGALPKSVTGPPPAQQPAASPPDAKVGALPKLGAPPRPFSFPKPSDHPELLPYAQEIRDLVAAGKLQEQIFKYLFFFKKVETTLGRLILFLSALKGPPVAAIQQAEESVFRMPDCPELFPFHEWFLWALMKGVTVDEIFDMPYHEVFNLDTGAVIRHPSPLNHVSTTRERVRACCEAIIFLSSHPDDRPIAPYF